METLLLVVHVCAAIGIVALVLLQHGKGADVGAAFGSGSAGSVFGSSGSANFLSHATAVLAFVFFMTSLGLTYFSTRQTDTSGVMTGQPIPAQTLPGQIPGQTPAGKGSPASPAAPSSAAPGDAGKVQDVPK